MANDGELVFGRDHFSLNGVEVPGQINKPVVVALPNMRNATDVELVPCNQSYLAQWGKFACSSA